MCYLKYILAFFVIASCKPDTLNSEKKYFHYINDKENRLIIEKNINEVSVTVKYLPPEYLVYKEIKHIVKSRHEIDSLIQVYNCNRTFLLTFSSSSPKSETGNKDLLYKDITNPEEYKQRLLDLTFNIGEYIYIKTDSNTYLPVLHVLENTYGITPSRSIYLVFANSGNGHDDLLTSSKLDFIFDDQVFMTGISHFPFKKTDLDNIPHINFWKK